jgi:FG-GAP repeat
VTNKVWGRFARRMGLVCLLGTIASASAASTSTLLFGSEPGGQFGRSVADAGDFNGDGVQDLLAGAPLDDTGGLARGRAFLWFGGAGMRKAADLVFTAGNAGDQFGYAVAGVGDVNNDGFDDIAVGAPLNDDIGTESGAVYIYYGGITPNNVVDLTLRGEVADDRFGWSVNRAGDMNRDGRDDFVVGAPWADAAGIDVGAVYLFYGANGGPATTFDLRWLGQPGGGGDPPFISGPGFGFALADLTGYRGDGRSSVAVGAPYHAGSTGLVFLFFDASFAGQDPPATAGTVFTNNIANELFGFALSRAGRIGNASRDDLLVGAPGAFGDTGYVKVFYGDATPAATVAASAANLTRGGETGGDRFGEAVCDVGNFDGLGGDDYAVGAPQRDEGAQNAGRAYVYSGAGATPVDIVPVNGWGNGSEAGDFFAQALSAMSGDLDGDGRDDFLVGSPNANDPSNVVQGVVAVIGSGLGVVPIPRIEITQRQSADLTEFVVLGLSPNLRFAQLRDAARTSLLLADWNRDFRRSGEMWIATVLTDRLVDVEQAELVWEDDSGARRQSFELQRPAPAALRLLGASPNPFNPQTLIRWELAERGFYSVRVYDLRGRRVRQLSSGVGDRGPMSQIFDGRDDAGKTLASGTYRVLLWTEAGQRSQGLTLTK